jgi:serine protease Do
VVRGQLGVDLHPGPMLQDEARALRLPRATGAIVMSVAAGSGAERGGVQPGDVIIALDGAPVADARDLFAHTAATLPGTHVAVTLFRGGTARTMTVTIDSQPDPPGDAPPFAFGPDGNDGLTLGDMPATGDRAGTAARAGAGVLVVNVLPGSPADDAELVPGDVVRAINGRPTRMLAEARRELDQIAKGAPIFLLVSRGGTTLFLQMRRY